MPARLSLLSLAIALMARAALAAPINDPPLLHPTDPHRFALGGQAWYPAGYYPAIGTLTSDQTNYTQYYKDLIDKLAAQGLSYFRNVLTMGQQFGSSIIPYQRPGPGTAADGRPKYDITKLNQAHFDYWRDVVTYARSKGIVVQITILDCWHNKKWITEASTDIQREWGLKYDFYQGANNVNGIDVAAPADFVDPTHPVFAIQKALVEKAVDALGDQPNIVWEVANEATVSYAASGTAWQNQLANAITAREKAKGFPQHLVMPRDLPNHEMLDHCETDAAKVHAALVTAFSKKQPLISDNDCTTNVWTPAYRRAKAWACLTAGAHIDFFHFNMREATVLASTDVTDGMRFVGYTRKLIADLKVNLVGMQPSDNLATKGWCLARSGDEYIVYLENGGSTKLSNLPPSYAASWFNPRSGAHQAASGGPTFTAPDTNDWVLHVVKSVVPPDAGPTTDSVVDAAMPDAPVPVPDGSGSDGAPADAQAMDGPSQIDGPPQIDGQGPDGPRWDSKDPADGRASDAAGGEALATLEGGCGCSVVQPQKGWLLTCVALLLCLGLSRRRR